MRWNDAERMTRHLTEQNRRRHEAALPRLKAMADALDRGDKYVVVMADFGVSNMTVVKARRYRNAGVC